MHPSDAFWQMCEPFRDGATLTSNCTFIALLSLNVWFCWPHTVCSGSEDRSETFITYSNTVKLGCVWKMQHSRLSVAVEEWTCGDVIVTQAILLVLNLKWGKWMTQRKAAGSGRWSCERVKESWNVGNQSCRSERCGVWDQMDWQCNSPLKCYVWTRFLHSEHQCLYR